MSSININTSNMQPNPMEVKSDKLMKDPATGLPLDPETGLPMPGDTMAVFSDVFDFFGSMFDLIESKSTMRADSAQIAGPTLSFKAVRQQAIIQGQTKQSIQGDITAKNIKEGEILKANLNAAAVATQTTAADNQLSQTNLTGVKPNPWIQNPSSIAALMIVSREIAKVLSEMKMNEGQLKKTLDMTIYHLGMEAADDAKTLRDMQASQETLKAMNSFVSAGIACYQMASIVNQRGKDEAEAKKKETEQEKIVTAAEANVAALEKQGGVTDTGIETTKPATPEELEGAKKNLTEQKAKLETLKANADKEFYEVSNRNRMFNEAKFKAVNSFVDGAFTLAGTVITKEQGVVEKHKAQLETMQQLWRTQSDALQKDRDDCNSFAEQMLSTATRTSSDIRASISVKG